MFSRSMSGSVISASVVMMLAGTSLAGVRVLHASPDTPNVDVYVNAAPGSAAPNIPNLAFRSITPYIPLPTDNYRFRVTPAGASSPVPIDVQNFPINASTDYTIAAIGLLSPGAGQPALQALPLVDDNTLNPSAARIRFVHASPDAPAVTVFAVGVAQPLFSNISFGNSGGYFTLPGGGTVTLEVRLASNNALALTVPNITFAANTVSSVFAVGLVGNGTLGAARFVDAIPAPGAGAMLAVAGILAARRRRA